MKRETRQRPARNGRSRMGSVSHRGAAPEALSIEEQKSLILSIVITFFEGEERDNLTSFVRHVGFDVCAVRRTRDFFAAWLGHYRLRQGAYDVDRACNDLATWPPIAARIAELRVEKSGV
nr:hypothetical protein [uncultured Defluviimonas sp.]